MKVNHHSLKSAAGLAALCLMGNPLSLLASNETSEGRVIIDWALQPVGEEPVRDLFDGAHLARTGRAPGADFRVVDASTDPPSPLPEGRPALMINPDEEGSSSSRVHIKPFATPSRKGWMEVEVVLNEKAHLSFTAWNDSKNMDPSDMDGRRLFLGNFRPGDTVALRAEPGVQFGAPKDRPRYLTIPVTVPSGVPTKLVILWDFESDPATFGFRVYGEWGGDPFDTAFDFEVSPEVAQRGVDAFSFGGAGFIGNVLVSAAD